MSEPSSLEEFLTQLENEKHPLVSNLRNLFNTIETNIHPETLGATRIQGEESGIERWFLYSDGFQIRIIRRNEQNQIDRVNDQFF